MSDVSILARSKDDEESCISDESGSFRLQNLKPDVAYTISVANIGPVRASWPTEIQASIEYNKEIQEYADLTGENFHVLKYCDLCELTYMNYETIGIVER